jgi:uncharacterized protein (TIGR00725 family)
MTKRLHVVGVLGSGDAEHADKAAPLGRWLATLPVHLLTGGGRGVMTAVARAFEAVPGRAGLVVGIIPCKSDDPAVPKSGYPNDFIELAIKTHLPLSGSDGTDALSRNHINVLTSDVLIALPGGAGTASEAALALRYARPIAAFIDACAQIPGLPAEVPILATLAEVQAFVLAQLEGVRPSGPDPSRASQSS